MSSVSNLEEEDAQACPEEPLVLRCGRRLLDLEEDLGGVQGERGDLRVAVCERGANEGKTLLDN